ncbi:MAG: ATP-binding cassette domain-containing protein [Rhizomicrobium sp.]
MIAILGRVGSGKSTLLRSIVRLLDPPPGTVYLDGRDIRLLPIAQVRSEIALVPQDRSCSPTSWGATSPTTIRCATRARSATRRRPPTLRTPSRAFPITCARWSASAA